jgi:hypothetical protein
MDPNMDPIDTTNRFQVGLAGDGIAVLGTARLLRGPISKEDALNLAAWLVAVAEVAPGPGRFAPVLEAVRNT